MRLQRELARRSGRKYDGDDLLEAYVSVAARNEGKTGKLVLKYLLDALETVTGKKVNRGRK